MRRLVLLLLLPVFSCSNKFYVVRHAEKETVDPGGSMMMSSDPPLSAAGRQRAEQLLDRLKREPIRAIFSTNFKRTVATAQPLAAYLQKISIEYYSSKMDSLDAFIGKLKAIRRGAVLVVGHSNTVDDIANKLCGRTVVAGDLKDTQYDNLFVITRKGKRYVFALKKYGAPSP